MQYPSVSNKLTHFEYKYNDYVNTITNKELEQQAKEKKQKVTLTLSQWIMSQHKLSGYSSLNK